MIVVSFIGTGNYGKANYKFKNKIISTKFFPYAVNEYVKPEKLFIMMTKEAEEKHHKNLRECIDNFEKVIIPHGKTEKEFWEIFEIITKKIQPNTKVILDITHGFRTLPVIGISLLLYLRVLKNIQIENILYGAFDATDENNITPVFELKSFIQLIDWSFATYEFFEYGSMRFFHDLLNEIQNNSYRNNSEKVKTLKSTGKNLSDLMDALETNRTAETFKYARNVHNYEKEFLIDLNKKDEAKPFEELFTKVSQIYKPIAEVNSDDMFSEKGLEGQKNILQLYLLMKKYSNAVTLGREYVLSKFMLNILNLDKDAIFKEEKREDTAIKLGKLSDSLRQKNEKIDVERMSYAKIWDALTEVRNDINHAGMRKHPLPTNVIVEKVNEIITQIINEL